MTDTNQPVATGVVLPSDSQAPNLRMKIDKMEHAFALAAPRGVEARQIVRDVQTAVSKEPKLLECVPETVLGGAMTMAQLGLRVGVLGHGWLLPMWNSKHKWKDPQTGKDRYGALCATLVIGYQGIKELAYRSGQIGRITAHTVHEGDHFDLEYGMNERLVHRPATGDRGPAVGYYSTVKLATGPDVMFYFMTHEEAVAYRDRYAMARKKDGTIVGPWADPAQFPVMAHKSCFRQLSKWVPLNTDLAVGLAVDESVRVDVSPLVDPAAVSEHPALDAAPETPRVELGDAPEVPVEDPPVDPDAADEAFRKGAKGQ